MKARGLYEKKKAIDEGRHGKLHSLVAIAHW